MQALPDRIAKLREGGKAAERVLDEAGQEAGEAIEKEVLLTKA